MKKTKILAILLYAVLAYSFVACSNSSGGSSDDKKESANNPATPAESGAGGGNEFTWPAFPSGALTVLPENTLGSAGLSDNTTITYVTFGLYPQTKKTDDITVSASTKTLNSWTVYAGSDNNYYIKDGAGYYKVEPIKWRILNPSAPDREKKILLAENILINCLYYDYYNVNRTVSDGTTPIYPNNYEHSRVRAFLNGLSYQIKESDSVTQEANNEFNGKGFLYTAFTVEERAAIADTSVVNNSESTNPFGNATLWNSGNNTYASDIPISDKIFLLSEAEVTKSAYGLQLIMIVILPHKLMELEISEYALLLIMQSIRGHLRIQLPVTAVIGGCALLDVIIEIPCTT